MKKRLDILVYEKGLAESREKAKVLIMAGEIFVDGEREDKPGQNFEEDALVEHHGKKLRYVSRGGLKLEKAMNSFPIELAGKICMDVGASTGGFTDCMLQNDASKVYAIDVGYGQLDWKLRNDDRVICLEKTNARYLTREVVKDEIDFTSIDVSFISLTLILNVVKSLLKTNGSVVALIKPQFEAGREKVGKKGVVRDKIVHEEVIKKIADYALDIGFSIGGITYSPVKGPEGNIEYLIFLTQDNNSISYDIENVVDKAHKELD